MLFVPSGFEGGDQRVRRVDAQGGFGESPGITGRKGVGPHGSSGFVQLFA